MDVETKEAEVNRPTSHSRCSNEEVIENINIPVVEDLSNRSLAVLERESNHEGSSHAIDDRTQSDGRLTSQTPNVNTVDVLDTSLRADPLTIVDNDSDTPLSPLPNDPLTPPDTDSFVQRRSAQTPHQTLESLENSDSSDDGSTLCPSLFVTDPKITALPETFLFNYRTKMNKTKLGVISKNVQVRRTLKGVSLSKEAIVAGTFIEVCRRSKTAMKCVREVIKSIDRESYKSFKPVYERMTRTKCVKRVPTHDELKLVYKEACDKATKNCRKTALNRSESSRHPSSKGVKRGQIVGGRDHAPAGEVGITESTSDSDLRRREKRQKRDGDSCVVQGVDEPDCVDSGGDIVARKLSSVSCGSFTVGEFARLVLILRSDESLQDEYIRAVRELPSRLDRDRRKSATEHYRNGLAKAFNNPEYRVLGFFPLYIKKVCVDFSGRKRSGEELKHELDSIRKGFTKYFAAFNSTSGQNEHRWHIFVSNNRDAESPFIQKLMVLGYVYDIQYRAGDIAFVSTISRLADDTGEASEQGGMGWPPVNSLSESMGIKTPTRGRRASGSSFSTKQVDEMIDKTVCTAIAKVREAKERRKEKRVGTDGSEDPAVSNCNNNTNNHRCSSMLTEEDLSAFKRRSAIIDELVAYHEKRDQANSQYERDLYEKHLKAGEALLCPSEEVEEEDGSS